MIDAIAFRPYHEGGTCVLEQLVKLVLNLMVFVKMNVVFQMPKHIKEILKKVAQHTDNLNLKSNHL